MTVEIKNIAIYAKTYINSNTAFGYNLWGRALNKFSPNLINLKSLIHSGVREGYGDKFTDTLWGQTIREGYDDKFIDTLWGQKRLW